MTHSPNSFEAFAAFSLLLGAASICKCSELPPAVSIPLVANRLLHEREWTGKDPSYSTEATYAGFDGQERAVLLSRGGSTIRVPLVKLSDRDQGHVIDFLANSPAVLAEVSAKAAEKIAAADRRAKLAETESARLMAKIAGMQSELERLAVFEPRDELQDDGAKLVKSDTLELSGRSLVGTRVKLLNCRYSSVTDLYDDTIDRRWGCFVVYDSTNSSMRILMERAKFGDLVLSLNRGQALNIAGPVKPVRYGGVSYLIFADTIELVQDAP